MKKNPILSAKNICKQFEGKTVLDGVSFDVNKGELVCLLGMSGCGKTTVFNIISGLLQPDKGHVLFENTDCTGKTGNVSYMMQKDLLLPWFTILDNVALPLRIQGLSKKDAREKAADQFPTFGLEGTEYQYPKELSGGMRQRASLLRTYLFSSEAVLLDEPFCALDAITKQQMHNWFSDISRNLGLSVLFITHDIDEALLLSDRILVLGKKPCTIYNELVINEPRPRNQSFLLSSRFIAYKSQLLETLHTNAYQTEQTKYS